MAVDHIVNHLDHPLDLQTIAEVGCISPFHFHRVFKSVMGETLSQFVKRVRLERALWMLSHQPGLTLTQIAWAVGFQSSSDFSRSFKGRYGIPPSRFDVKTFRAGRRAELEAATRGLESYRIDGRKSVEGNPDGFEVEIRRLPARCVAYIRVIDSFKPDRVKRAIERLTTWAEERGLADGQWLGYMWDDPEIVALKDCRYDVGLVVPDVSPQGEVGRFDFPAMTVAEVELKGSIDLEMRAIDWLYGVWLPHSGYILDDHPGFEAWIGRPFRHGDEYFEFKAQLPVRRR